MRCVRPWAFCAVLVLAAALPAAAVDQPVTLSAAEEHLTVQTGFEKDVLLLVKATGQGLLHRLSGYDENEYQIMADGIVVSVSRSRSDQVLLTLREKLRPRKYMAFLIESSNNLKTDKIAVIKGVDPYEILLVMHTNGDADDVRHEDVVAKLKQWGKQCSFEIVGAENDWVEIEFTVMPRDLTAFAEEVYEFSPDAVGEGAGNITRLIKEIKSTKRLMLWWE